MSEAHAAGLLSFEVLDGHVGAGRETETQDACIGDEPGPIQPAEAYYHYYHYYDYAYHSYSYFYYYFYFYLFLL